MEQTRNYNTKKEGKTEVYPFWNLKDIFNMINYFKDNEDWDNYLIFMFGLLLGRRIGDTVMVKWSDFFFENGKRKTEINTIEEQKTGKFTSLPVSSYVFDCIDFYCEKTGTDHAKHYKDYVFSFPSKTDWINRKDDPVYKENDLEHWCECLKKDFSEKRKTKILSDFDKQKKYKTLGDYLYYEVEYADVVKWQTDSFRKAFKKAADSVGITYAVSGHSLRKSFGYWSKIIHPDDPNCTQILMDIYNHSSEVITNHYIGITEERKKIYFNDFGDMLKNVEGGNTDIMINNSPVVSMRRDDLRKIITYAVQNASMGEIEIFNETMDMVDKLRIKNI